jgi:hypothetical protein
MRHADLQNNPGLGPFISDRIGETRSVGRQSVTGPKADHPAVTDGLSLVSAASFSVCSLLVAITILSAPDSHHWCIIPILLCGLLIAPDFAHWLSGEYDLFDPRGLIGIIGFHTLFSAPLLHLCWDYWLPYVPRPENWREGLGVMATLNVAGLVLYKIARHIVLSWRSGSTRSFRQPQASPAIIAAFIMIPGAFVLQLWVWQQFGGLAGYADAALNFRDNFKGYAPVLLLSESFPIILFLCFSLMCRIGQYRPSWIVLGIFLVALAVTQGFLGGMRGSRAAVVFILFWALGIVHLYLRPIPRAFALTGLVLVLLFMWAFTFYKFYGVDGFKMLGDSSLRATADFYDGHVIDGVILSDLSRANIQAELATRYIDGTLTHKYAYGRTYLAALTLLIPESIWPNRPIGRLQEGTEMIFGEGSFKPGVFATSFVQGLAGEAMLNFGLLGVVPAYTIYGLVVGLTVRLMTKLPPHDCRRLFLPLLILLVTLMLVQDSDVLFFVLVKEGAAPFVFLLLASRRVRGADWCLRRNI